MQALYRVEELPPDHGGERPGQGSGGPLGLPRQLVAGLRGARAQVGLPCASAWASSARHTT